MSALAGRTVLVTRSREQAPALCAAIEARGGRAVAFPTIELQPVADPAADRAIGGLEGYDWIAFTSANAVACFVDRMRAAGRTTLPAGVKVAAVGAATAAALAERGLPVAATPATYLGSELAGALGPLVGQRVLLPRSDIAREQTGAALRAAGAEVDEVVVYRTAPARTGPGALRVLGTPVDAVTFTSPSTVRAFRATGGAAAERLLRRAAIACIGPVTGDAVRELGLPVAVQPQEHTTTALVDALESFFATAPVAPMVGPR